MDMKIGLCLPNLGGKISTDSMVKLGTLADELGFDSMWTADHIIATKENANPYGYVLESLVSLAFLAAKTERINLGTSILVVPQRNPILVAKQVAAIDVLSHGRVILGIGAGWIEPEFDLLGEDFGNRGRRLDEYINLMRAVWGGKLINFSGEFYKLNDAVSMPRPKKLVPLWIGGNSTAAIDRASRIGDGWQPIDITPSQLEQGVRRIGETKRKISISANLRLALGRKGAKNSTRAQAPLAGTPDEVIDEVEDYVRAGLHHLALKLPAVDAGSFSRAMRTISKEILPSFE
jgi:probable F420-dependent oxidoreductase